MSADIEHWGARVAPGGALLIHDSFNAIGVMLAQLRLLVFSRGWRYRGRHGSLAVYRREPLDTAAMAVNAGRQLAGLAYFAATCASRWRWWLTRGRWPGCWATATSPGPTEPWPY